MSAQLTRLTEKFSMGEKLIFRDVGDGFIIIEVDTELCSASLALQGAHVMTWQPKGEEPVLWMSSAAKLKTGKAIRGGIPVCWPWFGAHASDTSLPAHGVARTALWDVVRVDKLESGEILICFQLQININEESPVLAKLEVILGATLKLTLTTENQSNSNIMIGEALHTYFEVGDVRKAVVRGLDGCDYLDKLDDGKQKQQQGDMRVEREVDRIYFDERSRLVIEDPVLQRCIQIEKQHSRSTIVWNPWIEKSGSMDDFGSTDAYLGMVCVESGNVDKDVVQLAPHETHQLSVFYCVEKL